MPGAVVLQLVVAEAGVAGVIGPDLRVGRDRCAGAAGDVVGIGFLWAGIRARVGGEFVAPNERAGLDVGSEGAGRERTGLAIGDGDGLKGEIGRDEDGSFVARGVVGGRGAVDGVVD